MALFPGSFDPFTRGHEDIARRAAQLFDQLIIAIGHNTKKKRYFCPDKIGKSVERLFDEPRVQVLVYNELTAKLAQRHGARYIVRGLRNTTDFEFENSVAQLNKTVYADIETVFLITNPEYAHISSTLVREMHQYEGDVRPFVSYELHGQEL